MRERTSWLPAALLCLVSILLPACSTYYERYRATHPEFVAALPSKGMTLEEVVASVYAPPDGMYNPSVQKLEILRLGAEAVEKIPFAELESRAFESTEAEHYGVIAYVYCQTQYGYNEKTSWYLLESNSLLAWDHFDYADRCVSYQSFEPARGVYVDLERQLTERVRADFPRGFVHDLELYRKGLALAKAGRIGDAERMLAEGDEIRTTPESEANSLDTSQRARLTNRSDELSMRARLVHAIEAARVVATDGTPAVSADAPAD